MTFLSLEPFIPSGSNFEGAKALFCEIGFNINWETGDYIGFEKNSCRFILQRYNNRAFAENLMINVKIESAELFWNDLHEKQLVQKYGIHIGQPTIQPYGKEVNVIDMAGVCWHFVE